MSGKGRPYVGKVREVRIPDWLWETAQKMAADAGQTTSEWVRGAVERRVCGPVWREWYDAIDGEPIARPYPPDPEG